MQVVPDTIVVVPAAPALIPDLAADASALLDPVLTACDQALSALPSRGGDVAVVAARDVWRDLTTAPTGSSAGSHGLSRSHGPAGPPQVGGLRGLVDPKTAGAAGWTVADYLLGRTGRGPGVRRVHPKEWVATGSQSAVIVADGSAARGPKAPRVAVPGERFDDDIREALASGALTRLSTIDDTAAARVGCTTAAVWRALGQAGGVAEWGCDSVTAFVPFGVAYFVARLHRR